jgi:hypothetical protein
VSRTVGGFVTGQPKPTKKAQKRAEPREISGNLEAIDEMIGALRAAGRLETVDSARVQIARRLARAVDENPENVGLWQQYRAAEAVLREVGLNDSNGLEDLFAAFDSAVRDAENAKPSKSRR